MHHLWPCVPAESRRSRCSLGASLSWIPSRPLEPWESWETCSTLQEIDREDEQVPLNYRGRVQYVLLFCQLTDQPFLLSFLEHHRRRWCPLLLYHPEVLKNCEFVWLLRKQEKKNVCPL